MVIPLVRKARPDDAAPLAVAGLAAWRRGIGPFVGPEVHARVTERVFSDFIERNLADVLVAEVAGEVVGFVATEGGKDYISDLWVSPDHAGKGVGSALLAAVEQMVRDRGFQAVEIEVMTENEPALRLYRRHGYAVTWQDMRYDQGLDMDLHKTHLRKLLPGAATSG